MLEFEQVVLQVNCQKGKKVEFLKKIKDPSDQRTEILFDKKDGISGVFAVESISMGKSGWLKLRLDNESCRENQNLELEVPVALELEITEKPEKITAMYLFNDWWTRPDFITDFGKIPERTQIAFLKYKDRYACIVPMAGKQYKTYLVKGKENIIRMEMTAYIAGMSKMDEPVFLYMEDANLYGAIEKAFTWLASYKGICQKKKRRLPEIFQYMGWCSWDAFYQEITEEKVRAKAKELREKKVPVRWILMDDGWLATKDELLYDYAPEKEKFPSGFAQMIRDIKQNGNISWFGVWHALGGYWGGVLPESKLELQEKEHLCYTSNGKILPGYKEEAAFGFYRDWYEHLRKEGIDFVKVDGQSAVKNYFENSVPVCTVATGIHKGLEGAASYMDGAIINCMGMAMENMLSRPTSAVSRNSDDFVPAKENGFAEHLLQNAYNALYQDELYYCDWDMFWTNHEDCIKHSLLRAISGGPVYFSDKIGETNPEVLYPLGYQDGKVIMMDRAAKPAQDCLFVNPLEEGVLKLTNIASYGEKGKAGGIAVYNLTGKQQEYHFSPKDVWDMDISDQYWIYDYFHKKAILCNRDEDVTASLERGGYAWYQILPGNEEGVFLGLTEKYVGFAMVESMHITQKTMTGVIKEQGIIGFLSGKKPKQIFCNGEDVTALTSQNGMIYSIALNNKAEKVCITVIWK